MWGWVWLGEGGVVGADTVCALALTAQPAETAMVARRAAHRGRPGLSLRRSAAGAPGKGVMRIIAPDTRGVVPLRGHHPGQVGLFEREYPDSRASHKEFAVGRYAAGVVQGQRCPLESGS